MEYNKMTNFKHNYDNIHLLTLYPFSNPNRDDMNRPKEMFFKQKYSFNLQ